MKNRSVAVIGAGVAGLAAGRQLARAGCDVVIFEKARGVGGRTSTRRSDADAFDHGAQYFTCRTEAFAHQVDDWCRRGVAAAWRAHIVTLGSGERAAKQKETRRYVGVPGMSALARDLAKELRVECGRRITRIEGSAGSWNLVAEEGLQGSGFDAVVVATPALQAVPLLAPAPHLAEMVSGVEMQPCHAVMVSFSRALEVDFGGAFVTDPPLAWVGRNASKPGRPSGESWVLHASPGWSAQHLEEPCEAVTKYMLRAFADAMGRELPSASFSATHRWSLARANQPLGTPFLWEADTCLGVCGDWMHGDRVEDAFTSGELLAVAMLREKTLRAIRA